MQAHEIIVKPLMTEKVSSLTETANIYGFEVNKKANKYQIKSAVEYLFDVKVTKVRTVITAGKTRRAGKHNTKSNSWKKAYVEVQEGQKIEFFKNI